MWPSVSSPSIPSPSHRISRDAERVAQQRLDVGARQRRVAVRVQQALLGRQQRAFAVDLDRAALEHDARLGVARHAERFGHLPADLPIEIERRVLAAPGVVVEVDREPRCIERRSRDEDRAVIARPGVVGREAVEPQALGRNGSREQLADVPLVIGAEHVDVHGLALGERPDERDHGGLDAREDAGPAIAVVRPRQPGRFVRRPFGGLAVAQG